MPIIATLQIYNVHMFFLHGTINNVRLTFNVGDGAEAVYSGSIEQDKYNL